MYRVCGRRPCWRIKTIEGICIKIEYISQRKIIVLFRSSNMAVVHTLYISHWKGRLVSEETVALSRWDVKTNSWFYYSTHCNTAQIWPSCTEYSSSVVNRYPAIYVISCVRKTNGKIKIVSSFSVIKLHLVINVFNNKTNIQLNLAEYLLILASSAYGYAG